jgi:hypothetical protein
MLLGDQALERLLKLDVRTILDIGSGGGEHAALMRAAGREVTTISLEAGADYVGDFMAWPSDKCDFDAVWACHVLEHQVNPGAFLKECRRRLKPGGILAITVPPLKHAIVGGHVTLWNAGLLLYHLVLAGCDCRKAIVGTYGYNISVLVPNEPADLPELAFDTGDIERLAEFFPVTVSNAFNGELQNIGWGNSAPEGLEQVEEKPAVPKHVAICALGPSIVSFMDLTMRMGGCAKFCDEVWGINALGDILQCDRVFHMDDVRIQEIRAAKNPDGNIAAMLPWMKKHPGPIYTSRTHPDYPGMVPFPLEEVLNDVPKGYMNSTAAHAVAYAVYLGVKKITLFGMDFTYANSHHAEKGRACVEFWLGVAAARGIEIAMPQQSSLMDAREPMGERFYGYDTVDLNIIRVAGRIKIDFTEKAKLPTADEIEHRYDHTRHVNSLVEAATDQAKE